MLSALKNFGVTFLISAALFGIIAYFATGFVTNTVGSILEEEKEELDHIIQNETNDQETGTDNPENPGNSEQIALGESFNFLVITTDYRPDLYSDYTPTLDHMYNHDWNSTPPTDTLGSLSTDYRHPKASSIVLVRIDREKEQFVYSYFSPETRVYTSTGYHTLSDVYELYGKESVAEHIHAMTGLRIKYTALVNGYNFDELIAVLGSVNVKLPKDIYRDGSGSYTMQYETTVEMTGPNGGKWTERYPNTWILGSGENDLDGEEMYTVLSAQENSGTELEAKKTLSIDILQKYLTALAVMEKEEMKYHLAMLVNKEADWVNLKKPGEEPAQPADTDNTGADLPFDTTPTDPAQTTMPETAPAETDAAGNPIPAQTDAEGNPIPEETLAPWLTEPHEPDNPILETNYTMNDFDQVYQLLASIGEYDAVVLNYPGEFKAATAEEEACFVGNLEKALEIFMPYRKTAE